MDPPAPDAPIAIAFVPSRAAKVSLSLSALGSAAVEISLVRSCVLLSTSGNGANTFTMSEEPEVGAELSLLSAADLRSLLLGTTIIVWLVMLGIYLNVLVLVALKIDYD
jgi:hypothetical protein